MINGILLGAVFFFMLFLATITDAIKDSIDHKKGAETLYGFWHLMKHILRIELFAAGALFTFIMLLPESIAEKIIFIALVIVNLFFWKDIIWSPVYKSSLWKIIDNTKTIKLGWPWLDKKLGFDKQPPEGE